MQIHGSSEASKGACAGMVYLRMIDSLNAVHTSLVKWSAEYLTTLNKFCKWKNPIIILKEDDLFLTNWPLAGVSEVYYKKESFVQVATVMTTTGTYMYKLPVTKLVHVPLLVDQFQLPTPSLT